MTFKFKLDYQSKRLTQRLERERMTLGKGKGSTPRKGWPR
jgi:hypothetical protein